MSRLIQSQVQQQPKKKGGLLDFLQPFIAMGATAMGQPAAGAGVNAGIDLLQGDSAGAAKSAMGAFSAGGAEDSATPPAATQPEAPPSATPPPATQPEAPKGKDPRDEVWDHIDQTIPEAGPFLAQNPQIGPAFLSFLDYGAKRYAGNQQQQGPQQQGPFSG